MSDNDMQAIPLVIPDVPGKPEGAKDIAEAINKILMTLDGDVNMASSIFFTVGLGMAQMMGVDEQWIHDRIRQQYAGALPRETRVAKPGQKVRVTH